MLVLRSLVFLLASVCSSLEKDCSYFGLLDHLNLTKENYALANVQPVKNWTQPIQVLVDLIIFGIMEVNEKSQTLTSHSYITMGWLNEFLHWDPEEFCGMRRVAVPRQMLWSPDVHIHEDVSDSSGITLSPYFMLYHRGFVLKSESRRLTTTCLMRLSRFPMDTQVCEISFKSFLSLDSVLTLGALSNSSVITLTSERYMITQGEWELKDITVVKNKKEFYKNYTIDLLTYRVTIERKPLLYVMNFIIPLFFLLVLDVASFFISNDNGEKLGFKVTVLLSISVLMLLLQDILPSSDDNLPMIVSYSITIFIMVGFSVLESMLVKFLIDLGKEIEKEAQSSAKACKEEQGEEPVGSGEEEEERQKSNSLSMEKQSDSNLLSLILEEVATFHQQWFSANSGMQSKAGHYVRVAKVIDCVFFTVYVLVIVIFLVGLFKQWCYDEEPPK